MKLPGNHSADGEQPELVMMRLSVVARLYNCILFHVSWQTELACCSCTAAVWERLWVRLWEEHWAISSITPLVSSQRPLRIDRSWKAGGKDKASPKGRAEPPQKAAMETEFPCMYFPHAASLVPHNVDDSGMVWFISSEDKRQLLWSLRVYDVAPEALDE